MDLSVLQSDLLPDADELGFEEIYHLQEDVIHESCFDTDAADVKLSDADTIGFPKLVNGTVSLAQRPSDFKLGTHFDTISKALTPLAVRVLLGYLHDRKAGPEHSLLAGFKDTDPHPAPVPSPYKFFWGSGSIDKRNRLHTVSHNVRTRRVVDGHVWRLVHVAFSRDNAYDVTPVNVMLGREAGWLLALASDIVYSGLECSDDVDYALLDVSKATVLKSGDTDFRLTADFKSTPEVPIDVDGKWRETSPQDDKETLLMSMVAFPGILSEKQYLEACKNVSKPMSARAICRLQQARHRGGRRKACHRQQRRIHGAPRPLHSTGDVGRPVRRDRQWCPDYRRLAH